MHHDHPSGTRDLGDAEFVDAFESLTLADDRFRHYDHLRLAWIFLREGTDDEAVERATARIATDIRRFAAHHGGAAKYHETMTRAYMHFVAAHVRSTPHIASFDGFAAIHPDLFDKRLALQFYGDALLQSDAARHGWVEPDLAPLPVVA